MAYPKSRSMNSELAEGATDGKYKKVINNRGGVVESTTHDDQAGLNDAWFGIHETPVKTLPDGTHRHTLEYVETPPAPIEYF